MDFVLSDSFSILIISLQRLSHEVGWGYKDVVDRLEEKRKLKAKAFHERKVSWPTPLLILIYLNEYSPLQTTALKLRQKATVEQSSEKLTQLGY